MRKYRPRIFRIRSLIRKTSFPAFLCLVSFALILISIDQSYASYLEKYHNNLPTNVKTETSLSAPPDYYIYSQKPNDRQLDVHSSSSSDFPIDLSSVEKKQVLALQNLKPNILPSSDGPFNNKKTDFPNHSKHKISRAANEPTESSSPAFSFPSRLSSDFLSPALVDSSEIVASSRVSSIDADVNENNCDETENQMNSQKSNVDKSSMKSKSSNDDTSVVGSRITRFLAERPLILNPFLLPLSWNTQIMENSKQSLFKNNPAWSSSFSSSSSYPSSSSPWWLIDKFKPMLSFFSPFSLVYSPSSVFTFSNQDTTGEVNIDMFENSYLDESNINAEDKEKTSLDQFALSSVKEDGFFSSRISTIFNSKEGKQDNQNELNLEDKSTLSSQLNKRTKQAVQEWMIRPLQSLNLPTSSPDQSIPLVDRLITTPWWKNWSSWLSWSSWEGGSPIPFSNGVKLNNSSYTTRPWYQTLLLWDFKFVLAMMIITYLLFPYHPQLLPLYLDPCIEIHLFVLTAVLLVVGVAFVLDPIVLFEYLAL